MVSSLSILSEPASKSCFFKGISKKALVRPLNQLVQYYYDAIRSVLHTYLVRPVGLSIIAFTYDGILTRALRLSRT